MISNENNESFGEKKKKKTVRQSKGFLNEKHSSEWCKLKQAHEKSGKSSFCLSGRSRISGPSKQSRFLMQNKETKRSIRSKGKHMKTYITNIRLLLKFTLIK